MGHLCTLLHPEHQMLGWGTIPELQLPTAVQAAEDPPERGYNRSTHILHIFLFLSESWCLILWHRHWDERIVLNFTNPLIFLCLHWRPSHMQILVLLCSEVSF